MGGVECAMLYSDRAGYGMGTEDLEVGSRVDGRRDRMWKGGVVNEEVGHGDGNRG